MQKNFEIKLIKGREILDSRKKTTVEISLISSSGKFSASVPSGTSKGKYEAEEKPARIAVDNINKIIASKIKGKDPTRQKEIDEFLIKLDGTKKKSRLGANAILGTSIAVCRAGAKAENMPLWKWISKMAGTEAEMPFPSLLQIEGGLHADRGGTNIQEFMTVFQRNSFKENFKQGLGIYRALGKILLQKYGKAGLKLGLEGAFIPSIKKAEEVLDLIMVAAEKKGFRKDAKIILDVAATHEKIISDIKYYLELAERYPIIGFEDPFPENSFKQWQKFNAENKLQKANFLVIGDDLTVTNPERIKKAQKEKFCNAVIIKPNQIGTVSETIAAAKLAKSFGWKTIVSHRSGETEDDFIADLAVGLGADFIKSGAPFPKERMVKYNRLLKIEKELCQN